MKVMSVASHLEGYAISVERNQRWSITANEGHPGGSGVYIWSRDMVLNAQEGPNGTYATSVAGVVDRSQKILFGAMGLNKQVNIISCPVVFWSSVVGTIELWSAATANLANAVIVNNVIHMTDPGNELFRLWTEERLQEAGASYAANWVSDEDAWNIYHIHQGDLHCGSNIKRKIPVDLMSWWNNEKYQNWGEQ